MRVRPFLSSLAKKPQAGIMVGDCSLLDRWRAIGITSQAGLRSYRYAQVMEARRYDRVIAHAERVRRGERLHIINLASAGSRPQCMACHMCGPLESVMLWLAQRCPCASPSCAADALPQLHAAKSRAIQVAEATSAALN